MPLQPEVQLHPIQKRTEPKYSFVENSAPVLVPKLPSVNFWFNLSKASLPSEAVLPVFIIRANLGNHFIRHPQPD